MHLVKGHAVPVRTSHLRKLNNNLDSIYKYKDVFLLRSNKDEDAIQWATIVDCNYIIDIWKKFIEATLANFLMDISNYLKDRKNEPCYLASIADALVYALKAPLSQDPLGGRTTLLYYHQLLGLLTRIEACRRGSHSLDDLKKAFDDATNAILGEPPNGSRELAELSYLINNIVELIHADKVKDIVETVFYGVPADPRPGYNISNTILSILLTSAIAASTVASCGKDPRVKDRLRIVNITRLAALAYGLYLPFMICDKNDIDINYIVNKLFAGVLEDKDIKLINDILNSIVGEGSESSSSDEVRSIVDTIRWARSRVLELDTLYNDIKKILENKDVGGESQEALYRLANMLDIDVEKLKEFYNPEQTSNELIRKLKLLYDNKESVYELRSITEILVRELVKPGISGIGSNNRVDELKQPPCGYYPALVIVDIGGVQAGLAETTRMRSLSGYSLLIDYLTLSIVPLALSYLGVGFESIIFAGGGSVQAIMPLYNNDEKTIKEEIARVLWSIIERDPLYMLSLQNIKVRIGSSRLDVPNFNVIVARAYENLTTYPYPNVRPHKVFLHTLLTGIAEKCADCGMRPAVLNLYPEEKVCLVCASRYLISYKLGYYVTKGENVYRLRVLQDILCKNNNCRGKIESIVDGLTEKYVTIVNGQIEFLVMDLLAGTKNYAVIKSDGNMIGLFMSAAKTPTIYFERSMRLDMSTKKAISKIVDYIVQNIDKKECNADSSIINVVSAFVFGFMYAGGDDSLLIVPARIALPVAAALIYIFSAETGFLATLSSGIVGAPVKHNLWWSIDAATLLLDEVAKSKEARINSYNSLINNEKVRSAGYVAFDYTDGWGLTSQRALLRHKQASRKGVSVQPLSVAGQQIFDLANILISLVGGIKKKYQVNNVSIPKNEDEDETFEDLLLDIIIQSIKTNTLIENISEVRKIMVQAETMLPSTGDIKDYIVNLYKLYIKYLVDRKQINDNVKELVNLLFFKDVSLKIPSHDIYLIYKFIRGD